ncbi:MAG: hypothetical protein Q4C04_08270 [Clostridia bacterium]|nr:hypothetical protein [Clostridia bacterium]
MRTKWLKIPLGILIFALLFAPLGLIYVLTNMEMKQYQEVYVPPVTIKSYGEPLPVFRMDMREFVNVSGTYVSTEQFYMELPRMRNAYSARISVNTGDYIEEGEVIGYTQDGQTEILSTASGVVLEIHMGDYSYFVMENDENIALSCLADKELLRILQRSDLALTDVNGNPVELLEIGRLLTPDGKTQVLLKPQGGTYGLMEEKLKLYTGRTFTNALVISTECLFHLPESPNKWYLRVLDDGGNFVENKEVQVGFSDGEYTCITGIEEGVLVDSGYAAVMGGE